MIVLVCLCNASAFAKFVLVASDPTARLFAFEIPLREFPPRGVGARVSALSLFAA